MSVHLRQQFIYLKPVFNKNDCWKTKNSVVEKKIFEAFILKFDSFFGKKYIVDAKNVRMVCSGVSAASLCYTCRRWIVFLAESNTSKWVYINFIATRSPEPIAYEEPRQSEMGMRKFGFWKKKKKKKSRKARDKHQELWWWKANRRLAELLSGYEDGALRPTAVDRPWASCTFQTGNSCTSSFLSGLFLRKIMLQKARKGKEINRGVVDQPFSHLYSSAKMKRPKAEWA